MSFYFGEGFFNKPKSLKSEGEQVWILTWKDFSTTVIVGDKFYKTFLKHYSIMDLKKVKAKKYGRLKM